MEIIKCPECQQDVSVQASFCPNCGCPMSYRPVPQNGGIAVPRGFALAAVICASVYAVFAGMFCAGHIPGLMWDDNSLINAMGSAMYLHAVLLFIGVIFGWSGFFTRRRNQVLVSAILYSASAVFGLIWLIFMVLPIVFGFVGYARMKPRRVYIYKDTAE